MDQSKIDIEVLRRRAAVMPEIRAFFNNRGYIEADVPSLTASVIPEAPIELFRTELVSPYRAPQDLYLLPSPEYYLKQLIAAGSGDIFSISKSFRNSEQSGRWHNPEFTMLEWYQTDADYLDSITTAEALIDHLIGILNGGSLKALAPPFLRMSMNEVFQKWTSFDLSKHCTGELSGEEERKELRTKAAELGLSTEPGDSWEELFNLIFVHEIEPKLPTDKPLVIYDYPAGVPALAKPAQQPGRLERWELYAGGIELANCYSEETDPCRVADFFRDEIKNKGDALVPAKADKDWPSMYDGNFPRCSGTAMGIDRLIMLLTGKTSIEGVILFPFSDILWK